MRRLIALCSLAILPVKGDLVQFVHTEIGTANGLDGERCNVSNGNLYPMVARPWGFGGWSPMTRLDGTSRWFYDYNDQRICGIRYTRQPSPWIGDNGAWSFCPVVDNRLKVEGGRLNNGGLTSDSEIKQSNNLKSENSSSVQPSTSNLQPVPSSWYSHKTERFGPDRYSVFLPDYGVTAEITPALHGAIARFTYSNAKKPGLVVSPFKGGKAELSSNGREICGYSVLNKNWRGWGAPVKCHFRMVLSRPAVASVTLRDGSLYAVFAPLAKGEQVTARIAVSMISQSQAAINLRETEGKDFDALWAEARHEWNERLGHIRIESDDVAKMTAFYSCFYRTMLFPLALWERDENGKIVHWSPSTGKTEPGHYYAGTGYWDTFRALYPLVNLLAPEMNAKMMEGLQHCWRECGWLPEWSNPGLSNCMIGNHSASVVADAWLSGVRGCFDINELWKALVHGANNSHPKLHAVGRIGAKEYNEKGYVPRDIGIKESAARTLEYAYDDWCLAMLAKKIGRPEDEVELYRKRSENWRNVFDPKRKIAVGRNADGSFNKNFNRLSWGGDFTEGCALHYTWSVFHDVPGLISAMGGEREFGRRLEEVFTLDNIPEGVAIERETHEEKEMRIVNFGQYAHGNQPIQHAIYLFDWCGAWYRAQHWAREVMERLYLPTPDGYCGDEDNGQTSAWYVWSAMGMYPVCPGSGEYALGAPLFDKIEVSLPSGKMLVIEAKGANERKRFTNAEVNGRELARPFVRRDEIVGGGRLTFWGGANK